MFGRLEALAEEARTVFAALDPDELLGSQAARALEVVTEIERRSVACRTRLAGRVEEAGGWHGKGHRSAAHWLADKAGTSLGAARNTLETAGRMDDLPVVQEAFEAGKLSEAQAKEVARAAEADPEAQSTLVGSAGRESLRKLKERCGRTIAAADPDENATHDRIHRNRSLTWGTDADGTWRLHGTFTPDAGAAIRARLQAEANRIFNQARADGRRESPDAYVADALEHLCRQPTNNNDTATPKREAVILVDLAALRRGHTLSGETCEIAGVGPVPVEIARDLLDDAFIKAVIRDGTDIRTVAHYGRHCPAELRTALDLRDPTCSVPGCDNTRTEIDHNHPYAAGGAHSIDNDNRLCPHHHQQTTHHGHQLEGTPGQRSWLDADGTTLTADPPPDTDPDPP